MPREIRIETAERQDEEITEQKERTHRYLVIIGDEPSKLAVWFSDFPSLYKEGGKRTKASDHTVRAPGQYAPSLLTLANFKW